MTDVTVKSIDDMEPIYGGLARRARAELGVTAWGMQVLTLPPDGKSRRGQAAAC
ncbi:MAG TPA: hypothetical protein VF877_05775 [Gaiellaceae bacterium]